MVFVTTELAAKNGLPDIPYDGALPRAEMARKLFNDILKYDKVEVCKNLTKEKIVEKLVALKTIADDFEKKNLNQSVCHVSVIWIGHKLSP